jgi:hypothetical protein
METGYYYKVTTALTGVTAFYGFRLETSGKRGNLGGCPRTVISSDSEKSFRF